MSQHITHEPHDETAWICLCWNTPDRDGFTPCDSSGIDEEPTLESGWDGLYRCERCLRIICQSDRQVVGRAHRFMWEGIEIEVRYWPRKWTITHLEIQSIAPERAPLPITSTGYRSHFVQPGTVEASGGDVVAQVRAWLDEEAAKPEWREHVERGRQGELFRMRPNHRRAQHHSRIGEKRFWRILNYLRTEGAQTIFAIFFRSTSTA